MTKPCRLCHDLVNARRQVGTRDIAAYMLYSPTSFTNL